MGLVGGVIGYAVSTYVAKIYVEITQPTAVIKTFTAKIEAAPYQFIERYGIKLAEITQNSDLVEYHVLVKVSNLTKWKVCLWVGYMATKLYEGCATQTNPSLKFTIPRTKTMGGTFYIYASIQGRTTDKEGIIELQITPKPIP